MTSTCRRANHLRARHVMTALMIALFALPAARAAAELTPVAVLSVPPLKVPGPPPQGVPPSPQAESEDHYVGSEADHEELQRLAASDPTVPAAGQVLASSSLVGTASVTTTFPGLNYPASLGLPPDTTLAKSGSRVLEATNSSVRLFNTSGGVLSTTSTASLFGVSTGMTDPKVFFDNNSAYPRFILLVADSHTTTPPNSNLYLAVSRTPNPSDFSSANWCEYWLGGPQTLNGVQTFYDSPIFGVGADTLVFTTNQYSFGGSFEGVILNAGGKVQLENNAPSCPWFGYNVFVPTPIGSTTFSLMPAQHYTSPSSFSGTTNPVYIVSTHGLTQVGGEMSSTVYRVWRVRNVVSGAASLDELDVSVAPSYSTPPGAPQAGGGTIDEGDARVRQVAGIGNSLWTTHATTCSVNGSNQGCIRVLRFDVGQDGSGNLTASVGQSPALFTGPAGVYYWMPALAATSAQSTIVVFLTSSSTSYLSSLFTTKRASATLYGPATTLLAGGCNDGFPLARSGDYQGAQTNPGDLASFWIAGEATAAAGQCSTIWTTQIANVTP
jgi:hypothetical protein